MFGLSTLGQWAHKGYPWGDVILLQRASVPFLKSHVARGDVSRYRPPEHNFLLTSTRPISAAQLDLTMSYEPQQLPGDFTHESSSVVRAMKKCRQAEAAIMRDLENNAAGSAVLLLEKKLVNVRILGHLLIVGLTSAAQDYIAQMINPCQDEQTLVELGEFYDKYLIRAFAIYSIDMDPSPLHLYQDIYAITEGSSLRQPMDQSRYRAKSLALMRDNYRCMLTGRIDIMAALHVEGLGRELNDDRTQLEATRCAYIFPEFLAADADSDAERQDIAKVWDVIKGFGYSKIQGELKGLQVHSLRNIFTLEVTMHSLFEDLKLWFVPTRQDIAKVWDVIKGFGYSKIQGELKGLQVHSLRNIFTLEVTMHSLFEDLKLWFVPTASLPASHQETPNRYVVEASMPGLFECGMIPRTIEFKTTESDLELPSGEYLNIRATCCRVYHLSGAAKYFDKLYNDDDLAAAEDLLATDDLAAAADPAADDDLATRAASTGQFAEVPAVRLHDIRPIDIQHIKVA
ncbi:uncharacterized protein PHACADRAFT_23866 [Phanerochaete carnosa HHB-10118-sp]|uniref:HNH nuclease domain-containing protein n=1 Tax=Phanerochaete carnosa (strain HHB-10118-sp) TaxID=650164 RepID=K5VCB5_PHACS|nr:uncharacterized protein PHACADRAFT_23866 [Phanerochaete carnosa HHB-10118-sp]EKM60571.1 hypothetical protein PHACADRAFT_23866 [Phanerochaete carnosa HHB-10118-sp]